MNQLPVVLSVLALGLGGTALVLNLKSPPTGAPATSEPAAATPVDTPLAARVAELEARNRELGQRLALLESQPPGGTRIPAGPPRIERGELEEVVQELLAEEGRGLEPSEASTSDGTDPAFTEAVAKSMREIAIARAEEGAEESVRMRSEYLTERLAFAAEELGMGSAQTNQLETALLDRYEVHSEWGVLKATGEVQTGEEWGELFANDQQEFTELLGSFLTPQQVEDYFQLGDGWAFPYSDGGSGKK